MVAAALTTIFSLRIKNIELILSYYIKKFICLMYGYSTLSFSKIILITAGFVR